MNQRTFHLATIAIIGLLLWSTTSHSSQVNPPNAKPESVQEQTKSVVARAVDYIKAHGKKAAFREFNNTEGQFVKGLSYVFVVDHKGEILANGGEPNMVATNKYDDKDVKGNYIIRDIIAKAKSGGGWVNYYYSVNRRVGCKSSYVVPVQDYIVASGYYHEPDANGNCASPE